MLTTEVSAEPFDAVSPGGGGDHVGDTGLALARAASQIRTDLPLIVLDAALTFACYFTALVLRFDGAVPPEYWDRFPVFVVIALLAHLGGNRALGLYRQVWRHASVAEARCVIASGLSATAILVVASMLTARMPLSVVVMGGGGAMMLTGALRFQSRLFAFRRRPESAAGLRMAIIGAGESGAVIVREMRRNAGAGLVPVAVLDDDPRTHGRSVAGTPVVGAIDLLPDIVGRFGIHQVVLAIPSADAALVGRVASLAEAARVAVKITPSVKELLGGQVSVRDVRELRVEDLLGRQEVVTDLGAVRTLLCGRRVLVTGAGGSIGSEIARQVALCGPAELVLVDHDETHLFDAAATLSVEAVQVLADIRNAGAVRQILRRYRPEVLFHAAAHKHVPLLEHHPSEAVATNVVATANLVRAAAEVGVERFVFVSTDKAVEPTSVMGASKWLGEQLVMRLASPGARNCAVRFGNVAGSRGSVIPTFARQIAAGGPVTVTDPAMTRFFMSVQEAVQLVLQAAALADGGEVFMLEMGEPVNIMDLAERMVRLSGRNLGSDVAVVVTGPRPGEKLTELLRAPSEEAHPTEHAAIVRLYPRVLPSSTLDAGLEMLTLLSGRRDEEEVTRALFGLVNGTSAPACDVIALPGPEGPARKSVLTPRTRPGAAPSLRRPGRAGVVVNGARLGRPAIMGGEPAFPDGLAFARPLTPPLERVMARLAPSYESGALTNGPLVRDFEEAAATRLGVAHAVAVSSCTSGLILTLQALEASHSVVLPSFTFSASAHAVAWNGLQPVFAECDDASFQLDPVDAAHRLGGAGALMATHVFGAPAAVERLEALARHVGVPLVFDAAHAFGSRRLGRPVGGFGDAEVFSLSPTKLVAGGEGGVVATNRADIAEAVRLGRDYGNPGDYDTRFVGLNARLSELHAALALESLALLDEHLDRRRSLAQGYLAGLADLSGIEPQTISVGDETTWKDFAVTIDEDRFGLPRDVVVHALRAEGIDVRCYFSPPVHCQQSYAALGRPHLPVTEKVASRVLCLPMHAGLSEVDVARVVDVLAGLHARAGDVRTAAALAAPRRETDRRLRPSRQPSGIARVHEEAPHRPADEDHDYRGHDHDGGRLAAEAGGGHS